MSCDITKGRVLPCKQGSAGLLAVYFLNRTGDITVSYDVTDPSLVDDIQVDAAAADVFKYELDNDGANYNEELVSDRNNGTLFYNQNLTLVLQSLQEQDKPEFDLLAKGRPLVIIHLRNGKALLAGISRGMDTSGNNASGGALGDFQGYTLNLVAVEDGYAPFLKGATKEDPFAGLTTPPTVTS